MRILMVNKFLYPNGGSETYILKLGAYLEQQGHEVQYFGMEHEGRCVGNEAKAYTSNMDFHSSSSMTKIRYSLRTIYSVEARRKIRKVLNMFQPEIVHLNNFNFQLTPSIIVEIRKWESLMGKPIKIIYTAHDYQLVCPNHLMRPAGRNVNCEKCLDGSFINCIKNSCIHGSKAKSLVGAIEGRYWGARRIYKEIDTVICPSDFMKSKLDKNAMLKSKTVVLRNFVDIPDKKRFLKKEYILYFGRFSEEKGVLTLLEVCNTLPDIKFVFAGSGPLEHKVQSVSNVVNVGFQTGDKLKRLIGEALFCICPSECYENCPFSVMESQMYGTPVIGADIGGIPELIIENVTGELFESGNQDQLREKIAKLWRDRELQKKYSANCRKNSFDDLGKYYLKLMKLYHS